jgi:hypothetical protein
MNRDKSERLGHDASWPKANVTDDWRLSNTGAGNVGCGSTPGQQQTPNLVRNAGAP